MVNYGKVRGNYAPKEIEITSQRVFVAKNIQPYEEDIDGHHIEGYEYDYSSYTKDEYIELLAQTSFSLEEQLEATKVLLGVE